MCVVVCCQGVVFVVSCQVWRTVSGWQLKHSNLATSASGLNPVVVRSHLVRRRRGVELAGQLSVWLSS